jgi:hypothetical protein
MSFAYVIQVMFPGKKPGVDRWRLSIWDSKMYSEGDSHRNLLSGWFSASLKAI